MSGYLDDIHKLVTSFITTMDQNTYVSKIPSTKNEELT
jgi:hypothetical protein